MHNKVKSYINKDIELTTRIKLLENSTDDILYIAGYANKYRDEAGNIIPDRDDEALKSSGIDLTNYLNNPVILGHHDRSNPIGKAISIDVRADGLYIEASIHKILDEKLFYSIKNGIVSTFSVGFRVLDGKYIEESDLILFTATELFEVSCVAVPSNPESSFSLLIDPPCGTGTCLLANKTPTKASYIKHNKSLINKEWSSVDKRELKESLKDAPEDTVRDAYLTVKDLEDNTTWKFPHHDYVDNTLVINKSGLVSAFNALKSLEINLVEPSADDISSIELSIDASKHLKGHFQELFEQGLIEESLLTNMSEFINTLEGSLMKKKDDGTTEEENTINTPEETEEGADNNSQEPKDGEAEPVTPDSKTLTYDDVTTFISEAKNSSEGLEQLFTLYANITDTLNEALQDEEQTN